MKESDQYHKWVEWSEEDQAYIGKCPDLITGIRLQAATPVAGEVTTSNARINRTPSSNSFRGVALRPCV
jgi:hypothetical protein